MSAAYGNPPRGNETRWNNDPNSYGTQNSSNQNSSANDQPGFQPGFEDQGYTRREGARDNNAVPGAQYTAGHGDSLGNTGPYPGNTSDNNVPGAGTGDWQQSNAGGNAGDQGWNNNQGTGGHPSVGQRVKGTAEKVAGKVTGNTGTQQRGEQRRENV
ncbi:uncharacterized protein C8Q71DRAFT_737120, partial [Rhodofomes roseus]